MYRFVAFTSLLGTLLAGPPLYAKDKSFCSARELERRDCRLIAGDYNVRILNQTVAGSDGIRHNVNPIPLTGDGVSWEKIQLEIMNKRPILQYWLWDKGVGESQVQSLHWYVADASQHQVLAEGVVRKRRLKPPADESAPSKEKTPPKPKYLFDNMETHGLKALKDGSLEWSLGSEKKKLEKVKEHGI